MSKLHILVLFCCITVDLSLLCYGGMQRIVKSILLDNKNNDQAVTIVLRPALGISIPLCIVPNRCHHVEVNQTTQDQGIEIHTGIGTFVVLYDVACSRRLKNVENVHVDAKTARSTHELLQIKRIPPTALSSKL